MSFVEPCSESRAAPDLQRLLLQVGWTPVQLVHKNHILSCTSREPTWDALAAHCSNDMCAVEAEPFARSSWQCVCELVDLFVWKCDKIKSLPPTWVFRLLCVSNAPATTARSQRERIHTYTRVPARSVLFAISVAQVELQAQVNTGVAF